MKKWLIATMVMLTLLYGNAWAGDRARAVIIFDASGSMWGQIEGKTKIEIARDALKNVVQEWNPDVDLGLTVYGHRRKGDCSDIESLIPVGKIDRKRMISTVMKIQPKGKTPISRSLRKVADEIKFTEERATIILISDGKESCDADPCGMAKKLAQEGVEFITHVIGFNVDKKTDKQLQCIADVTGGVYFPAKDAKSLNEAMKSVVSKVTTQQPEPEKLPDNLMVTASESKDGALIKTNVGISPVSEDEDEGVAVKRVKTDNKTPVAMRLPAGRYLASTDYDNNKKETLFEIKKGEIHQLHLILGTTAKVNISASEQEGGKWVKTRHHIHNVEDGTVAQKHFDWCDSRKKKSCERRLPVGAYSVKSQFGFLSRETPFELKAGEMLDLNIVMGETGVVKLSATQSEGGKWVKARHHIHRVEDGTVAQKQLDWCDSRKKESCERRLPVGQYVARSEFEKHTKITPFEIESAETTTINVSFTSFIITATCMSDTDKLAAEIYASSGRGVAEKEFVCSKGWSTILDDGVYTIEVKLNGVTRSYRFKTGAQEEDTLHLDLKELSQEESL